MPTNLGPQSRLLLKALALSVALNVVMIVLSALGGVPGGGSLVQRIADALAAPPGAIAQRVFAPKEHSAGAFAAAAAESLAWSIFFYGIVAWVILESVSVCQWIGRRRREAHR
jgi:hypothetical protein